jgi:hypothetical protein
VTDSWLLWMLVLVGGALVWFLPTMIALLRGVHGLGMVVMIVACHRDGTGVLPRGRDDFMS